MVKHLPVMRVDPAGFNPWVRKIPGKRKWQPTPVLLPGKSHGWRSLVGYSPWGCKELDVTEQLHFTSLHGDDCNERENSRNLLHYFKPVIPWIMPDYFSALIPS